MGILFVCRWCGSRDVWADWDVKRQAWVLRQVFDDGFCQTCGCERMLEAIEAKALSRSRERVG